MPPYCPNGHTMIILKRFRLDRDRTDTVADQVALARLKALGVDLGADVTVWYCLPCDHAEAQFAYPES